MGRRALVVALVVGALTWSSAPGASAAPMGPVQHVQVGDISVGYRAGGSGSGPPLVLIMGYGGAMNEWDPALLERLADQRRVVAVQPTPAVIALLESATRNDLIEAIFPPTRAARAAAKAYLARVAAQPGLQESYFEISPGTIRAQLVAELAWNRPGAGSYASLGSIAQPTLVIDGALDRVEPPANSRIIADRIPSSLLKLYPGGGHAFMYQYPTLVSKNVGAFLG